MGHDVPDASQDRSDFAYYFLAVLGIIAVAVILKRKI
jgi:hypothetical protein